MKKRRQVVVTFKTKPIIFDVDPLEFNQHLFGKRKKEVKRK